MEETFEDFQLKQAKFLNELHAFIQGHEFFINHSHDNMEFPSGTHHEYEIYPGYTPNRNGTKIYIDRSK